MDNKIFMCHGVALRLKKKKFEEISLEAINLGWVKLYDMKASSILG
jgi:hypothetical protein